MTLSDTEEVKRKRREEIDDDEEEGEKDFAVEAPGEDHDDSGSDSDSDEETNGKREREALEGDEVEALKKDLGEDAREGKRIKRVTESTEERGKGPEADVAPSKESEEVWKSLQSGAGESTTEPKKEAEEEMIVVKKKYRFAGEEVNEEKLLPATHPDAVAYLASLKETSTTAASSMSSTGNNSTSSLAKPLPAGPPGPRKKKSSLAAMSAAATGKPTKINTLEKSAMDWNKFKQQSTTEREREEMEAQTRGGGSGLGSMKGYLERKSFLERVQDRLNEHK